MFVDSEAEESGDNPTEETVKERFPVWGPTKTGGYESHTKIIENLGESNVELNLDLEAIRSVEIDGKPEFFQLVKTTAKELGVKKMANGGVLYKDLIESAKRQNLVRIPAEAVLQFLIQNNISDTSKEEGEWVDVVMKPLEYEGQHDVRYAPTRQNDYRGEIHREGTGEEFKNIFSIHTGSKNSRTSFNETKAPNANDIVGENQIFLFAKVKESK